MPKKKPQPKKKPDAAEDPDVDIDADDDIDLEDADLDDLSSAESGEFEEADE